MSDWSTFRTAIEAALRQALPSAIRAKVPINWSGGARQFGDRDGRVLLSVTSDLEEMTSYADLEGDDVETENSVTVQVLCESQHDDPTLSGARLSKLLALGLRKESVTAILEAAGIGFLDQSLAVTNVGYLDANQRRVSAFAFDALFSTTFTLTPEADDAIGAIEHVSYEGTIANPGASDLTNSDTVDDPTPGP